MPTRDSVRSRKKPLPQLVESFHARSDFRAPPSDYPQIWLWRWNDKKFLENARHREPLVLTSYVGSLPGRPPRCPGPVPPSCPSSRRSCTVGWAEESISPSRIPARISWSWANAANTPDLNTLIVKLDLFRSIGLLVREAYLERPPPRPLVFPKPASQVSLDALHSDVFVGRVRLGVTAVPLNRSWWPWQTGAQNIDSCS
jgi:hypothetical protein